LQVCAISAVRAYVGSDDILQVALNRFEALKSLEEALGTITTKMAYCQFYATMYAESLQITLDSNQTTTAFREGMASALPEFYAAVLVFSVKASAYFLPSGSGKLSHLPRCRVEINYTLAKLTNYLKSFSVTLEPFINDINATQHKVQDFADMATMEKIEGNNQRISFSVVILHIKYTILIDSIQETTNIFERC